MNQYTFVVFAFGILALLLSAPSSSASVMIACSPNASPKMRELCYALEQIRSDTPPETGDFADTPVYDRGTKRQDVDHVFLRFGRRMGF